MNIPRVLVTGFVNQNVPYEAIDHIAESPDFPEIEYVCTTGIGYADKLTPKIRHAVVGHVGLMPELVKRINDPEDNVDVCNIPQGVMTQLVSRSVVVSPVGANCFVEHTLGVLSGKSRHHMAPHPSKEQMVYTMSRPEVVLMKVDTYYPYTNTFTISGVECDRTTACELDAEFYIVADRVIDSPLISDIGHTEYKLHNKPTRVFMSTERERPARTEVTVPESKLDYCHRAASLRKGDVINIGIGLPELVGQYIQEHSDVEFTVESGIAYAWETNSGYDFGTTDDELAAMVTHQAMFEIYHNERAPHIDTSYLGVVAFTADGKINVHNWNGRVAGTGGFVDIARAAKRVVFCASDKKLVNKLTPEQVTYDAAYRRDGQEVFIITETRVIKL